MTQLSRIIEGLREQSAGTEAACVGDAGPRLECSGPGGCVPSTACRDSHCLPRHRSPAGRTGRRRCARTGGPPAGRNSANHVTRPSGAPRASAPSTGSVGSGAGEESIVTNEHAETNQPGGSPARRAPPRNCRSRSTAFLRATPSSSRPSKRPVSSSSRCAKGRPPRSAAQWIRRAAVGLSRRLDGRRVHLGRKMR